MKWFIVTAVLCIYGFLKEFRPVEPFLTPYLQSPLKNFTDEQLYSQVYPYWTYSYLIVLIPTFVLTDLFRYKPIIIFEGITYAATWILLIWGHKVKLMQLMQIFYGCASATEVAYFAYIYAAVDSEHYKKVTSFAKAAIELGDFLAYGLGQVLIHIYGSDYQLLNDISLGSCILIIPLAVILPWIPWSTSFKKGGVNVEVPPENATSDSFATGTEVALPKTYREFVKHYFLNLWMNFKTIYSTTFMWKWSLWWALATCGFFQVGNYIQNLWAVIQPSDQEMLNGVVEAINTLLSCIVVVCMQFLHVRWEIWGETILALISIADFVLLITMSQSSTIILVYIFYILFTLTYQMMFTIGMYNIAKRLTTESYGLVFGFNTFIALGLQTILTIAVADQRGFNLDIRPQFVIYGCYYGCIAVVFTTMGAITIVKNWNQIVMRKNAGATNETTL